MSCFEDLMNKDVGASNRILNLAINLKNFGHIVHIIIPGQRDEEFIVDGLIIHRIKGLIPTSFLMILSKLLGALKSTALYFFDPYFMFKSYNVLSHSEIVQLEQPWSGLLFIPFIKTILRKPVVLDSHDVFQSMRLRNDNVVRRILETFFEKIGYLLADLVLVVSGNEKDILIEEGFDGNKIIVVPNGVDIEAFSRSYGYKQNQIEISYGLKGFYKIIFVGNMEYLPNQKAAQIIISKIAPELDDILGKCKFLLIGRCPISLRKNSKNVIFTGVVEDVADYLNISNVAIAPLLRGSGTRLKILEYFSCGLPVVSTSMGSKGLGVKNGVNILIEDDLNRFALRIKRLLTDNMISKQLGTNARNFVIEKYSWTKICDRLIEVYDNLS